MNLEPFASAISLFRPKVNIPQKNLGLLSLFISSPPYSGDTKNCFICFSLLLTFLTRILGMGDKA